MTERKEAVRAWAYLRPDKNLATAKLYAEKWRAMAAARMDACTDPSRFIPVEIRPAPTGEGHD